MSHSWVTIAIPMAADRAAVTRRELRRMGNPAAREVREALRADMKVHFMSTGVIDGDPGRPAHLVIEISADETPEATIDLVARALEPWYGPVFEAAGVKRGDLAGVMRAHHVKTGQGLLDHPGLDFTGSPGMTVKRIREEWRLARGVRDLFDETSYRGTALEILDRVRADVRRDPRFAELQHLLTPEPTPCLLAPPPQKGTIANVLGLVGPGVATFLWPVWVPALLLTLMATVLVGASDAGGVVTWLVTGLALSAAATAGAALLIYSALRQREATDLPDNSLPDEKALAEIAVDENRAVQNHMTGVSRMKHGYLRRFTLRLAFWFIGQLARTQFRPGFLGEIGTIHFARWVLLPGTDQLLFFSNYGGSWESYLEDFITKAHNGLTGVWSNTEGFPRASNLFADGATDGDRFKRWARRQQQPTPFWYSAYPHVSTARIRANAAIRQGLACAATREEAELWLAQVGSRTPPPTLLETREIQTPLFGGLKHHPHATLLALAAPADRAAARAWLAGLKPLVGFGDQPDTEQVGMLALGPGALAAAGLDEGGLATFPFAFRDGMASPVRSKVLADTGDDKPADWLWGGDNAVDAVLVLYGRTREALKAAEARALKDTRARLVHRVALKPLEDEAQVSGLGPKNQAKEAFGFADGVSQPLIKGARRWRASRDRIHEVEPGEFILGYPDNRGFLPLSPSVPSEADPQNRLATVAPPPIGGFAPDLSASHANLDRDLGRNGTFLVVRQLAQDVERFDQAVNTLAGVAAAHPGVPPEAQKSPERLAHWLAAKMIGRWKDGTSLVRYPHRPGTGWDEELTHIVPDNDFLLGAEDPVGHRCPFGAHIRRANPRESFEPGSMEQLAIVNRHRILRAGRRYDGYVPAKGKPRENEGLMFMCFNADLERQFEFVQQTWMMAPQFHGLENEVDAILGRGRQREEGGERVMARLTIPTPEGPLHVRGLPDVVRVRGGGYFFVPSKAALDYLSS